MIGTILERASQFRLTKRQLEVALLLGKGKALKEIASDLNISMRTVVNHSELLRKKMGTPNTLSAVVKLLT